MRSSEVMEEDMVASLLPSIRLGWLKPSNKLRFSFRLQNSNTLRWPFSKVWVLALEPELELVLALL